MKLPQEKTLENLKKYYDTNTEEYNKKLAKIEQGVKK